MATPLIFLLAASYFLMAALVPGLRLRWGCTRRTRTTILEPHMGTLACLAMTILLGSLSLSSVLPGIPRELIELVVAVSLVLVLAGAVVDWTTEPRVQRRNR